MNQFVLYLFTSDGREIYWDGISHNVPNATESLLLAAKFPTASAAYGYASNHAYMQKMRVGRRPNPVNLRGIVR